MGFVTDSDLIMFNGQEITMEILVQGRLVACVTGRLDARNVAIVVHNDGNYVFFEPEYTERWGKIWMFRVPIRELGNNPT